MDDAFLNELRATPPPDFRDRLRARLNAQPPANEIVRRAWFKAPAFSYSVAAAVVAILFTVPAVRASAEAFLNLFRVQNFVAVPVNPEAIAPLANSDFDLPRLIGNEITMLEPPAPTLTVGSLEEAAAAARMTVATPAWLPMRVAATDIKVQSGAAARVIVNTNLLEALLQTLSIHDVEVPHALNGQSITLRMPPQVTQDFEVQQTDMAKAARGSLIQLRTPEVTLPPGMDLAAFGEIGLRVLGVSAREARTLAQQIDWNTTLVVPIPPGINDFRQMTVRGHQGLAVEGKQTERGTERMIIWSTGDRVFGLQGTFNWDNLLRMAESIE